MKPTIAIVALAACLVLQGCRGAPGGPDALDVIPDDAASIIGDVTQVDAGGGDVRMLVEQIPTRSAGYGIAWVRVTPRAVIVERDADGVRRTSSGALTVGLRVQVWFNGPVAESYPVQANAGTIVIER